MSSVGVHNSGFDYAGGRHFNNLPLIMMIIKSHRHWWFNDGNHWGDAMEKLRAIKCQNESREIFLSKIWKFQTR